MKQLIFFVTVLGTFYTQAQQILWARAFNAPFYPQDCHLGADGKGNFYRYGSAPMPDPFGFLTMFDGQGQEIYTQTFSGKVKLTSLANVAGQLFLCGSFSGAVNLGEHALNSKGHQDGFIAAVDPNGIVQWVSLVDGSGSDAAQSICYNRKRGSLIVTGQVAGSFVFNGQLVKVATEKNLFVSELSLQGELLYYQLHDFRQNDTTGNKGLEVCSDEEGKVYLLHYREGRHWSETNSAEAEQGVYLSALDSQFNPAWSQFIISNSCYYGYQCAGMAVTGNGESFVPSFCSYKYGGEGLIRSYVPGGNLSMPLTITDGTYNDLCSDGINVFAAGTESANGCPCESGFPGYPVIRKISGQGASELLAVLDSKIKLSNITVTSSGVVIASGYFREAQAQVGPYVLSHSSGETAQQFLVAIGNASEILGLQMREDSLFSVYPNPSDGDLNIQVSAEACDIVVTDLLGRQLFAASYTSSADSAPLRIPVFYKGACIVSVSAGTKKQVKKVIVR